LPLLFFFFQDDNRPTREQIIEMRRFMLLYMKQLVISSEGTQEEELQAILNYLHTVHEVNDEDYYFELLHRTRCSFRMIILSMFWIWP